MRFVQRVSSWPRAFPPPPRRALPTSSTTSSVLCPRPTPRRRIQRLAAFHLPAFACRPPLATRHHRGLPAPVQETLVSVPNSFPTSGGKTGPDPLFSDPLRGLPPVSMASAPPDYCFFEAPSPGPLSRPPTLHPACRHAKRKDGTSQGWIPPGVGFA